jgi:hypothetical protein
VLDEWGTLESATAPAGVDTVAAAAAVAAIGETVTCLIAGP